MSERKEFQPLAKGAKETCSYPCGNLEHDHYYVPYNVLDDPDWEDRADIRHLIDFDLVRDIERGK